MQILVFILFLSCYFFCFKRLAYPLLLGIAGFTIVFLYEIFGAFVITIHPIIEINYWVIVCGLIYFSFWFFSFYLLSQYGILGVIVHSFIMVFITFSKVMLPLHPFIILYPEVGFILPSSTSSFINLLIIFLLSGVLFCRNSISIRVGVLSLSLLLSLFSNFYYKNEYNKPDLKVAVIQVGLYFDKGGSTTYFFNDLLKFLSENPNVNSVVFAENNIFSFKTNYNKNLSEKLLEDIRKANLQHKYHLFLSFNGYKDFNNIVTLYQFKDKISFNQKRTLIPFIEKSGVFNKKNDIASEFYYIDRSHKNKTFNIMGSLISTYICFDALFPEVNSNANNVVLIQSNYKLLDKGYGYDKMKLYATYLAKFLNGIQGDVIINIQNHGGSVVLYDNWRIDHNIYKISKDEPFFVINIGQLTSSMS